MVHDETLMRCLARALIQSDSGKHVQVAGDVSGRSNCQGDVAIDGHMPDHTVPKEAAVADYLEAAARDQESGRNAQGI